VTLRVKNIGDESQTFDASNQKAYAGSTAYEADGGASLFANENSKSFLEGINPGKDAPLDNVAVHGGREEESARTL
jgi:hypothetical protein